MSPSNANQRTARGEPGSAALTSRVGPEWRRAAQEARISASILQELPSWVEQPFPWCSLAHWAARACQLSADFPLQSLVVGGNLDSLAVFCQLAEREQRGDPAAPSVKCREAAREIFARHFQTRHTFWAIRSKLIDTAIRSAGWDQRRRETNGEFYTTPDLARMGERYLTAAIAPTAVAFLARRGRLERTMRELALSLGCATSLLQDHRNLVHDFSDQRNSAVVADLSLCPQTGARLSLERLCQSAEAREALFKNLQRARLYLAAAESLAEQLRMPEAIRHIADRAETVDAEIGRLSAFARRDKH